eukprot:gene11100-biopygen7194
MTLFPLTGATWRELSANWNSANCELKSGNSVRHQSAVALSPQSPQSGFGFSPPGLSPLTVRSRTQSTVAIVRSRQSPLFGLSPLEHGPLQSAVRQSPQSAGVRYGRVRCQSAVRQGPQSLQSALELWRCISAAA